MARFESPCQVISLFLSAGVVAVILILLINIEVKHRQEREAWTENDDGVGLTVTAGIRGLAGKVVAMLRSQHPDNEHEKRRTKREVIYKETETSSDQDQSQLFSEGLLSEAASGHRVRNMKEKIEEIGENSQLVKTVLDLYCAHRESVTFFLCYDNSTSAEDGAKYEKNVTNYINLMSERLSPPSSESGEDGGICNYHNTIIITVGVTTFLNSISFLILLTLCKKSVKAEVNY